MGTLDVKYETLAIILVNYQLVCQKKRQDPLNLFSAKVNILKQ